MIIISTDAATKRGPQVVTKGQIPTNNPELDLLSGDMPAHGEPFEEEE